MDISLKLLERSFTIDNGEVKKYFVLNYKLVDGSDLDLPVKGDKAKLLLLSLKISNAK